MQADSRAPLMGMALLLIGLSLLVGLALTAPAHADPGDILYAAHGGATSGACDSWANACTLQYALSQAASGDEIWVKEGVHYPGTARTDSFTLKDGVALYGGFAGTESSRTQRNWQTHVTVLSGDIDGNDTVDANGVVTTTANIKGSNSYHVVRSTNVTSNTILDGFVITAGRADGGAWPHYLGGGMYNANSSRPTLTNIIFSGNKASEHGGGMFNSSSHPTLTNVTFSGNKAEEHGGGMYNSSSHPTLTGVTFSGNVADYGGGMYNSVCHPTLAQVTFSGNDATYGGGGIYNGSSNPTLTDVTFSGNTAPTGGGMYNDTSSSALTNVTFSDNHAAYGSGMYNQGSNPTLANVTFSNNNAGSGGGGMYNSSSSPTLTKTTFSGNTVSSGVGGGMCNSQNSNPRLTNVTFGDNAATDGGGMYNYYSSPTLTNTLFFSNTATNEGGGMFTYGSSSPKLTNVTFGGNSATYGGGMCNRYSSPTLTNVILWGNFASYDPNLRNVSSTPTIAYSDVGGCFLPGGSWKPACGTDGGGNISANPRFLELAGGNLHLRADSPCIDKGNNAAVTGVTTDLDGNPRIMDGDGNGTPVVDMGAYEIQPPRPTPTPVLTPPHVYLPVVRK